MCSDIVTTRFEKQQQRQQNHKTEVIEKVGELADQLEGTKKSTDKLSSTTRKLEREVTKASTQIEVVEKDRSEMESKKRAIEKELAKVSSYLKQSIGNLLTIQLSTK
jgi:hypothetical protein